VIIYPTALVVGMMQAAIVIIYPTALVVGMMQPCAGSKKPFFIDNHPLDFFSPKA
jgi:hypothetical protein